MQYKKIYKRFLLSVFIIAVVFVFAASAVYIYEKSETDINGREFQSIFTVYDGEKMTLYSDKVIFTLRPKVLKNTAQAVIFAFPAASVSLILLLCLLFD